MPGPYRVAKTAVPKLPVESQSKLGLPRVVGRRRLTCETSCSRRRIAKLVYGGNVGVVEQVENIGNQVEAETLAKVYALGNAQVELEEHRHNEFVAAEISDATQRRRDSCHGKRRAAVGLAGSGQAEGVARYVRRSCGTANRRANFGGAQIESRVFAGDDVVGTPGRNFN